MVRTAELRNNCEACGRQWIARGSRPLRHPPAQEAAGDPFHSGRKFWTTCDNPEWQIIKRWIEGVKSNNENS